MTSSRERARTTTDPDPPRIEDGPDTPRCAGLKREPQGAKTSPDVACDLPRPALRHVLLEHHVPSAAPRPQPGAVSAPQCHPSTAHRCPAGPPGPGPPNYPRCLR